MPVTKPTFQEMLRRTWNQVSERTGLNNNSESGFAINILRVFCQELSDLWDELEYIESQSMLSTATGNNLDKIGQFYGVTRRAATYSGTVGGPLSVKFTNNGGIPITIPSNTRVWVSSDPEISYFTVFEVTIAPGEQEYVDVKAYDKGANYNIGANKIDSHDVGLTALTVTNELPITTGRDIESDENYRVRIQQEIYRKEGANITAVKAALLEIPGVRDVQIINLARGTGTFDAVIYGYDRILPNDVLAECQEVLNETVSAGISAIAKAPIVKYVDVEVKVVVKNTSSISEVRPLISSAIRGYLDNLPIEDGSGNGTLIFQELAARVQESSPNIIDSDVRITVDDLPSLKSNQEAEPGERFISRVITVS